MITIQRNKKNVWHWYFILNKQHYGGYCRTKHDAINDTTLAIDYIMPKPFNLKPFNLKLKNGSTISSTNPFNPEDIKIGDKVQVNLGGKPQKTIRTVTCVWGNSQ